MGIMFFKQTREKIVKLSVFVFVFELVIAL